MVCYVISDLTDARQALAATTSGQTVLSIAELPPMPEFLSGLVSSRLALDLREESSVPESSWLTAYHSLDLPDDKLVLSGFCWGGDQQENAQAFMIMTESTPLPFKHSWIKFGRAARFPRYGEMAAAASR